jgi:hypothetical protein
VAWDALPTGCLHDHDGLSCLGRIPANSDILFHIRSHLSAWVVIQFTSLSSLTAAPTLHLHAPSLSLRLDANSTFNMRIYNPVSLVLASLALFAPAVVLAAPMSLEEVQRRDASGAHFVVYQDVASGTATGFPDPADLKGYNV